jgi:hypothetical protein
LHAIQLFRVVAEQPGYEQIVIAGHGGKIQQAHAAQGTIPERQPAHQVTQTVHSICSHFVQVSQTAFQGIRVSMDIAEKITAHDKLSNLLSHLAAPIGGLPKAVRLSAGISSPVELREAPGISVGNRPNRAFQIGPVEPNGTFPKSFQNSFVRESENVIVPAGEHHRIGSQVIQQSGTSGALAAVVRRRQEHFPRQNCVAEKQIFYGLVHVSGENRMSITVVDLYD